MSEFCGAMNTLTMKVSNNTIPFQALEGEFEGKVDVPLHVINNYFSVGADAQIALEFHNERGTLSLRVEEFSTLYRVPVTPFYRS